MSHVVPARPAEVTPAWYAAIRRALEEEQVELIESRIEKPRAGEAARMLAVVTAADPDPECATYHVHLWRTPAGQLTARCSCPCGRAEARWRATPSVPCKHLVVALAAVGYGPVIGIPKDMRPLFLAPTAHARTARGLPKGLSNGN